MKRKAECAGKRRAKELSPFGLVWRVAPPPFTAYEVSDTISPVYQDRGIVRHRARPKHLIMQADHEAGYKLVSIKNDSGEAKRPLVHQLTIIGQKPTDTHTVDHITPGRQFRAYNLSTDLKWSSKKEQIANRNVPKDFLNGRRSITRTHVETGEITIHNGWKEAVNGTDYTPYKSFGSALVCAKTAVNTEKVSFGYTFAHTKSEETFKPIPSSFIGGAEGYEASEKNGWIKRPDGSCSRGCLLARYYGVKIRDVRYGIHTLVAAAWVTEGYAPGKIANHIDHAQEVNNDAANLNWCTPQENVLAAVAFGSIEGRSVYQYSMSDELIAEYTSLSAAARAVKGHQSSITKCCEGKSKLSKGYKWRFKHT
jgi:hypothetical protein